MRGVLILMMPWIIPVALLLIGAIEFLLGGFMTRYLYRLIYRLWVMLRLRMRNLLTKTDKLKHVPRVYLCGAINGCSDEECKDWRAYAKSKLLDTCDPMDRDYRGREDECYEEIVELDKLDIDGCHVVLVKYEKPSVGMSMEVLYAWLRGIPVIVAVRPGTIISPWLRYHATKILPSLDKAIDFILAMEIKGCEESDAHHYLFCAQCGKPNKPVTV